MCHNNWGGKMFNQPDNTYNELRENSLNSWLNELEQHEDVAVRGGVKLCREYIEHLKTENDAIRAKDELKAEYLKKIKAKG